MFTDLVGFSDWAMRVGDEDALHLLRTLAGVEVGGCRPRLRVGIHTGRPRRIGDDYLGVDVNIAARLAEKAGAGEILVSETTRAGLDPARVTIRPKRGFRPGKVKGVPDGIVAHVATPR